MTPRQKPGLSEQSVATPPDFLEAVKKRLDIPKFQWDLAADATNSVCPDNCFYSEEDNSFTKSWFLFTNWLWLNPPFSDISPWVEKAWKESRKGAKIAVLIPSSTGANWWVEWVLNKAYITFLQGRIKFVGHTGPYPKDLALLLYTPFLEGGNCTWKWR